MDNYSAIKSLAPYDSSFEIVRDYDPETFNKLSDDVKTSLEHLEDFESVTFCVLNDEIVMVLDSLTGDLQGNPIELNDFIQTIVKTATETAEE